MKKLKWTDLKTFIEDRKINLQYIEFSNYYYIIAIDGPLSFYSEVSKVPVAPIGSDQEDFEDNYKEDCNTQLQDNDLNGRNIVRHAATIKGWHYQAHSLQFEINKLNSIYNKDAELNDLGFAEIKIYKSNGDECTTQLDADSNGVKSVITWKPDFDFEIISGNIRQAVKETIDSYIHVRLKSYTGLPAPHDWFTVPFTQGGINMKYIGADELLKTDGRASKLVKATNGDYFEIIANYAPGLLSGNNHEMSVIFEIYKDPTS